MNRSPHLSQRVPTPARACASILLLTCAFSFPSESTAGQAATRRPLTAGLSHVTQEYKAGTKFRTQESMDALFAEQLARRLSSPLKTLRADDSRGARMLAGRQADLLLSSAFKDTDDTVALVPTGYSSGPMAIMRTDTTIKQASQLRGQIVCVAEGSPYVDTIAARFGAIEQIHKSPADSLLALRIGTCDAAVHDSGVLNELVKLPEWKKFSASISLGPTVPRAFVFRREDAKLAAAARELAGQWQKSDFLQKEMVNKVRHIAFEVYLDQNVPDCH